jgi:hypothetical protein
VRESRRREEAKAEAEADADADAEVEADADAEAEPGSVADRVRRVRRHGHARDHMQISYMMGIDVVLHCDAEEEASGVARLSVRDDDDAAVRGVGSRKKVGGFQF